MPFSGFYAPASYFVVLLEVFAVLLLACAVAAEYLGTIFERLYLHVRVAREEAAAGQELWAMLIEQLPLPALLVDADTLQVVCASELATQRFCSADAPLAGRSLFAAIRLSYPETVQELILGEDGMVPQVVVRVGEEFRVTQMRVHHLSQKGRRFALLLIEDATEAFAVRAALDAAEQAALVSTRAARCWLSTDPPRGCLPVSPSVSMPPRWCRKPPPAPHGGIPAYPAAARCIWRSRRGSIRSQAPPVRLPGEEEPIYVITFLPVAKAELAQQAELDATMGTRMLVRTR